MNSWCLYIGFVGIIFLIAILAGILQRHTLNIILVFITICGMLTGAIIHYFTPIDNNRTYNNYCRISAHSYSKGFEEGVRVTKEENREEK